MCFFFKFYKFLPIPSNPNVYNVFSNLLDNFKLGIDYFFQFYNETPGLTPAFKFKMNILFVS